MRAAILVNRGADLMAQVRETLELDHIDRCIEADFDLAMASDIRQSAREDVGKFLPMFRGKVRHVLYESTEIPVRA